MEGKAALFSVTDPSFCPQCGSILPLPGVSDVVCCKLCSFQQNTESWLSKINSRDPISLPLVFYICAVYEGVEEYSCKYFAERKERQKLVKKGDGPLVNHLPH